MPYKQTGQHDVYDDTRVVIGSTFMPHARLCREVQDFRMWKNRVREVFRRLIWRIWGVVAPAKSQAEPHHVKQA